MSIVDRYKHEKYMSKADLKASDSDQNAPLLRQIFACGSQRQPPVLDASDCDQMVCNTSDNGGFPTNNQDFETVIVIKVYVEG